MPATFKYYLREDRTNSKGECPIYLRITCHRKKKYFNTGLRINSSDWNKENEQVRRSHPNYSKLNEDIEILLGEAKEAARLLRREKKESATAIKERLVGASKKNFFVMAEAHKAELERNNQHSLHKQTNATLKKLEEFNGSKELQFTEINSRYLERFQQWMRKEKKNKGSTIYKNMSDVRRIIRLAMDKHLIFHDPFDDVKPIKQDPPKHKPKLSYKEIQKIENLGLPKGQRMWHVRNLFVLSFYFCGTRVSDMLTMKWKDVADGKLEYFMDKTETGVNIEIPEEARTILFNYVDEKQLTFSRCVPVKNYFVKRVNSEILEMMDNVINDYAKRHPNRFIFPFLEGLEDENRHQSKIIKDRIHVVTTQINECLDDITTKAKVNKSISSHTARHSFAQHMANNGTTLYELSGLLRHKSIKTTEQYLERINVQLANNTMRNAFK